jgi:predicted ArsR family transcriptional regulator
MSRMTQSRVDMLAALRALAPVTATVLGDALGVHDNTARSTLCRLRRLGLVDRDTVPGTGRGPRPSRWYLTAAGTAALLEQERTGRCPRSLGR